MKKRVSIPKHHLIYVQSIASQMGVDTTEALNYLLWELRKSNFQFGASLPQSPMTNTPHLNFDPSNFEKATAMSALNFNPVFPDAVREYEDLAEEIDPVIERLAHLVDSF